MTFLCAALARPASNLRFCFARSSASRWICCSSSTSMAQVRACAEAEAAARAAAARAQVPMLLWRSIALLRRHERRLGMRVRGVVVDAALDLAAEVADQPLDRPGGGVAERADGVALDLGRDLQEHVDLAPLRSPLGHAGEDAPHPAGALAAGGALAARLVLVEIRDAGDRAVEYDHGRGAKSAFEVAQGVEVHRGVDDLFGRHERDRRAARDRAQEV